MREWSIRIFVMGPNGEELPATIFDKVTYKLHPTFTNPTRGAYYILYREGEREGGGMCKLRLNADLFFPQY